MASAFFVTFIITSWVNQPLETDIFLCKNEIGVKTAA
jgi:hypothetical protein